MASRPALAVWHGAPKRKRGRDKGLEELADDTQETETPVSSSRGLHMSESVVVSRQAGGSQAGKPLRTQQGRHS